MKTDTGKPTARERLAVEEARLERALDLYRVPLAATDRDFAERLEAVLPYLPRPGRVVATRNWVGAGILLVASLALVPFGADFRHFRDFFGDAYTLPMALVAGLAVTLYCAIFVAKNIRVLSSFVAGLEHALVAKPRA